jgi:hypothetical protein
MKWRNRLGYNRGTVRHRFLCAGLLLASLSLVSLIAAPRPPLAPLQAVDVCNIQTTERIVAIGDVHGSFDNFVAILRTAGLIDNRRQWAGGKTVFVQTGDVLESRAGIARGDGPPPQTRKRRAGRRRPGAAPCSAITR